MKASRWEVLGAWLRIWTPPRDVEIPPIPRRGVALVLVGSAAAIGVGLAWIAPAIDRAKQREALRQQRSHAAVERRERARLAADQRPRTARSPRVARLYAAGQEARARAALLRDVRAHVGRDARARVAAGTFDVPIRTVRCEIRPGGRGERVRLSCLAVTTQTPRLRVGQPFTVAGSLRDGRFTWCHENPPAGEGAAGTGIFVALSRSCTM